MHTHFDIQRAKTRLAEWEALFEKYSKGHNGWSDTYKEYFVVDRTKYDSSRFLECLYEQSSQYPLSQHYLHCVQQSIEAGMSTSAPETVQISIYEIARLALDIRLYSKKEDIDNYINKATSLTCGSLVLRYYREAIAAHKLFAEYLLYGEGDKMLMEKASCILGGISSHPAGGCHELAKFQKLNLSFTKPKHFLIEELIRGRENHYVEFKAAVKDDPKRQANVNKDAITDRRLAEIVAFLNAGGGKLIIGVEDRDRSIHGIEYEVEALFNGSLDEYDSYWNHVVRDRIAVSFSLDDEPETQVITQDTVTREIIPYNGHNIYLFDCKRREDSALYFQKAKKDFKYIARNNNDSQTIRPEKLELHLKEAGRITK